MSSSKYADEGTIAHSLAAMCLTAGTDAAGYVGRLIEASDYEHAKLSPSGAKKWMTCAGSHAMEAEIAGEFVERFYSMEVTDDMARHVQVYLDMVRARVEARCLAGAVEVTLLVEQSLPIDHLTGEQGATGTGDVLIISLWPDDTAFLDVIDLKFGMGVVVDVVENEQLQMYVSGAVRNLELGYDIRRFMQTVHQPRVKAEPSDWESTIEDLRLFEARVTKAAKTALTAKEFVDNWLHKEVTYLFAGDHCRTSFCAARATCPAYQAFCEDGIGNDFESIAEAGKVEAPTEFAHWEDLSRVMTAADAVEDFLRAVRAEVERRLLAGIGVPGYKLVQGKQGNRAWTSTDEAEKLLKSFRLKHDAMYSYKLISPTDAEKLAPLYKKDGTLKPEQPDTPLGDKQWRKLQAAITRAPGKPSVAPESDSRPALTITATEDDFETVTTADDLG